MASPRPGYYGPFGGRFVAETLVPALVSDSYWVSVIQPTALMLMMLLFRPSRVNDPSLKNKGYANGQFILIRKDKYRSMGGHEAVRTQVVEDVHLGRNALAHGLEVRVVSAPQLAACKMYATVKQLINGWNNTEDNNSGKTRTGDCAVCGEPHASKKCFARAALAFALQRGTEQPRRLALDGSLQRRKISGDFLAVQGRRVGRK